MINQKFSVCSMEPEGYRYSHFLYDICKYLCYGIESAGYDCCMVRNWLYSDRLNIIVGAHNLNNSDRATQIMNAGKYILLQSEMITGDSINYLNNKKTFAEVYLPLMKHAVTVWTSLESNVIKLSELGIRSDLIQVGYHSSMEEVIHKKNRDIDFLYFGSLTEHRKMMLEKLIARGGKVVTMFDDPSIFRNDLIARTKVNLAPHQGLGRNHLTWRIPLLLNNRAIVVVEQCMDQKLYEECFPYADTDRWVDLCFELLDRKDLDTLADEYYERFKKIRMEDFVRPLIEKLELSLSNPLSAKSVQASALQVDTDLNEVAAIPDEKHIKGLTSIIIAVSNNLENIKKCLKSIRKHTPEPHELIFVDNGASGSILKWLQKKAYESNNYTVITNSENSVLARAYNEGMKAAKGEFILLLESDTMVTKDWLSGMLECLNSSPETGIVGPMMNNISGPQNVVSDEYRSPDYLEQFAEKFRNSYRFRRIPVRTISGFCMLFRRSLSENIGLLDESFGTGNFEDDDYCLRAELEGFTNVIAGDVFIHHYGSRSFIGNRIDYAGAMKGNRNLYEEKWSSVDIRSDIGKRGVAIKALDKALEYNHKGEIHKAVELMVGAISYSPKDSRLYRILAEMLIDARMFQEGIDALEGYPDENDPRYHCLRGYCLESLGRYEEALSEAEAALIQKSNFAQAINLKGLLVFRQGDREAASKLFLLAIEDDPAFGEAYTNLGVLMWADGKQDEAIQYLERGFVCSPGKHDVLQPYYSAAMQTGQLERAEKHLAAIIDLLPLNKRLRFLLIDSLIRQTKYERALREIGEAFVIFGIDDGMLAAASAIRGQVGPKEIPAGRKKTALSVCMIVKNEEAHLARCLHSLSPIADEIIIVDTGSVDRTKKIAEVYGAKVFDFKWIGDFSAARNCSLEQAKGDWILVMDADEVISHLDHDKLRLLLKQSKTTAFSITTRNYVDGTGYENWTENDGRYSGEEAGVAWVPSSKVRLFRNLSAIRFERPIHELVEDALIRNKMPFVPIDIPVHHYGKLSTYEKSKDKAEEYYRIGMEKLKKSGEDFTALKELAVQAAELNRYEDALAFWDRVLKLRPDYADAYYNMGYCYLQLNRFREGSDASRKALEMNPSLISSILNYASCELKGGDISLAINLLEKMVQDNPRHPGAVSLLGICYISAGRFDEGRESMAAIQKMKGDCSELMYRWAKSLTEAGKKSYAENVLAAAIDFGYGDENILAFQKTLAG